MIRALVATLVFAPMMAFASSNLEVKIDGMTCDHCVKSITENLSKIKNVDKASIKVILKENMAKLSVAKADDATMEQIKKAVSAAGYKVTEVKVN